MAAGGKEEIEVERHRYGALVLYELSVEQIEELERETLRIPEDLIFATVGLSVGISFLITLLTITIASDRLFNIFLIFCLAGFVVALYWGYRWFSGRRAFEGVIKRIKTKVAPLGQQGKEEVNPKDISSAPQQAKSEGAR